MKHVGYAESILAETLEEKDPGLISTGKTLAERQLEDECKEQITLYFETLTTEAKTKVHNVEQIHKFICENLGGGWRQPTRLEVSRWSSIVYDETNLLVKWGDDKYALKTED